MGIPDNCPKRYREVSPDGEVINKIVEVEVETFGQFAITAMCLFAQEGCKVADECVLGRTGRTTNKNTFRKKRTRLRVVQTD